MTTLIAFAPAVDSDAIVMVELDDDGNLVVRIELELGEEIHTLPAASVAPEFRALAVAPSPARMATT